MSFFLMAAKRAGGAAPSAPVLGDVDFVVTRWDGNTGNVMVTGAIPLPPGTLTSATLQNFRVYDSTATEKAIGVKALKGTFPDGSLRSVAVQFQHSVTNDTPESFSVDFSSTRTTTDFAYVEPIYTSATATVAAMNHKAVIIPDDADYWTSTFVALVPLKTDAAASAGAQKNWYSTVDISERSLYSWSQSVYASGGTITAIPQAAYDQGHGLLAAAIRSPNRTARLYWYQRFYDYMLSYLVTATSNYFLAASGTGGNAYAFQAGYDASLPVVGGSYDGAQPPEQHAGFALACSTMYLSTGWEYPWRKTAYLASRAWASATSYTTLRDQVINATGDGSIRFNVAGRISWLFAAYVIEANTQANDGNFGSGRDNDTYDWTDTITWLLDSLDFHKFTTPSHLNGVVGQRPSIDTGGGTGVILNYQTAIASKWLIFAYHNIINDSRIPTMVQALADAAITQMYYNSGTGEVALSYFTATPPFGSGDVASNEWYAYGPYLTEMFGFTYAVTGNATYKTWGDRIANRAASGLGGTGEAPSTKNFGEYFAGPNQSYLHYAEGGVVRPISGAHPTAVANQTTHAGP